MNDEIRNYCTIEALEKENKQLKKEIKQLENIIENIVNYDKRIRPTKSVY